MVNENNFLDLNLSIHTSPEQQPKSQQISDENLDSKAHSTQLSPRSVDKHKLTWMSNERDNIPCKKKIHKCPKGIFLGRNLSRGLKNQAGVKSHFGRKHMANTFNCPQMYTVQAEYVPDLMKCGSKTCVCGKVFPRGKYEYRTHQLWCPALAREAETKFQLEITRQHQLNTPSLRSNSNSFGVQQRYTPVFQAPPTPPPSLVRAQHFSFQHLNRLAQVEMLNQNGVSAGNRPFMGFSLENPNFVGNRGFSKVNNPGFWFL
ncbi:hypothetical protein FRX31_003828 [Thalictrum thalictroides]|uniref:Uncharacterized protein n=1 Tax=Thalictrum thalictroides TaxID=46969 RepID=A0A7J6XCL6_THATH|nr:hypothetical protein FRX31_003828 [Thalictrum thalictroides]